MKSSQRTLLALALAAPALIAGGLVGGCQAMRGDDDREAMVRDPNIELNASSRQLVSGEIATFSAASQNLLGREHQVEWISTGGEIRPQDGGRVARALFEQPGAYTVTALLIVDGREVDRDSITVNVRPLR